MAMDGRGRRRRCLVAPTLAEERALWAAGYRLVAGVDEAGRGAWAGPLVAAAMIFPPDEALGQALCARVRDSKMLTPKEREEIYPEIVACAVALGLGVVPPAEVDEGGLSQANRAALRAALENLSPSPGFALIDFFPLEGLPIPCKSLAQGDAHCLSIAAASIVAKVTRDRLMADWDRIYPGFGFARHKGYGTPQHRQALQRLGPSPIHRRSFAPIRQALAASSSLG